MDLKSTVLLIDDEENLLIGLSAVLRRKGFSVFSASSGSEGMVLARQHRPDVIVCDIMMPPPNGYMVRKHLSEDPQTTDIPFIFLTARSSQVDKLAGLNQGADDYITKPFDINELLARLQAVLRRTDRTRQRMARENEARLEDLRRSISSNISHEMRTPLGILINTLELAIHHKFDDRPADLGWYMETAMTSAQHLSGLVEDLIMLTEIDQNRKRPMREILELKYAFLDPIHACLERYSEKKLDILVDVEPEIMVSAPRLDFRLMVRHLVDNALKFSPPAGRVEISLQSLGEGGCKLTVRDSGSGIPPHLRDQVFDRYFQVSQGDTRDHGGLGLGLYLARSCARSLGGEVTILNSVGGCTIQLVLPPAVTMETAV